MKFINNISKYLYFKNPIFHFFLSRRSDNGFMLNLNSLWEGNKKNGKRIINGFLNFQGESFPINEFWKNNASKSWNNYLNSFLWLKDLRALGTNDTRIFVRNFIDQWYKKNKYYNEPSWNDEILSKRIFSLLTNLSFYFESADEQFQKRFLRLIFIQVNYLFSKVNTHNNNIFSLKAKFLASLCTKSLENKFSKVIEDLILLLNNDILDDGMYYTKSPSQHFFILCSLIDIRNFLGSAKKSVPIILTNKIDEMISVLKFFRIADGQLAIFNDHDYVPSIKIENVIKKGRGRNNKIPSLLHTSGYYRSSKNKLTFIMDCGQPTNFNTYAGALSFEFSHQKNKIVVNCGSPFINNKKWHEAMRSTAAHSTLNLDEINSSDIFFNKLSSVRKASVWSEKYENNNNIWINSAHSGYKSIFGIIHNRKIHIDPLKLIIRGQDYLVKPKKDNRVTAKNFYILFHIHPDIELNVTSSRRKVVLKLKNNIGWEFICSEPILEIGDGIYLGEDKKVQKNNHILIRDNVIPNKKIKWLFRIIN